MPPIEYSARFMIIKVGARNIYPIGWVMEKSSRVFSSKSLEDLVRVFSKNKVDYLVIGKSGAIIYGFPDTTQDIDIFPRKTPDNGRRIVSSLKELGFNIDDRLEKAIIEGKDFIQIRGGPFDIDLVFAPDGLESFDDAKKKSSLLEGKYPVASMSDIIKSKKLASRQKDREVINRLEEFAKFIKGKLR